MKWQNLKVADVCDLAYGKSLTADARIPGDYPVYGSAGDVGTHNNYLVNGPGIIIGRKGSVGKVYYEKRSFYPIDTAYYVVPKEGNDLRFLYYKFQTLGLEKLNSDAAVPGLNRNVAYEQSSIYPALPTQRKIASILSAYDDLIENNLKRIKLLEETIRTHYKIMLAENDGSWEKLRIEEAYDFSNGYAFYKDGYSEEGNIVIDLGNISESSNLIMTGKEKYVSELLYDDKKKFHLNKYDVIVAMTDMTSRLGILAKVALIDESNKYILNQRVGRLRSKIDYIDHCFVYASLSNEEFRNEMKTKAKGAVQIYFNTKDILEYEVTIPSPKKVQEFSKTITPIIDLRFSLSNQNTKLREARDILLPRLMSGQIEV